MLKKSTRTEFIWITLLLGVSLIGGRLGILGFFVLSIIYLLVYKKAGAVKILMLLAYRSIVNDKMFYAISSLQNIKLAFMFGVALYILLFFSLKDKELENKKITSTFAWIIIFTVYNIISAFLCSSLPMIAILKLLSYVVILAAVIKGIALTYQEIDWLVWLETLIGSMVLLSLLLYGVSKCWLGKLFNGFTNQPNMLGIVLVLFLAILIINIFQIKKGRSIRIIFIGIVIFLIFQSGARTSFISACVLLLLSVCFSKMKPMHKFLCIVFMVSAAFITMYLSDGISSYLNAFIFKYEGSSTNLLYSRESQIDEMMKNIKSSPLFGIGFGVPKFDFVSFALSYTFFIEPGNIVLAILSYSGIIGTVFFVMMLRHMLVIGWKKNNILLLLPLATVLVSMGEMVFFSSNSMAIWLYAFWGIYIFNQRETKTIEEGEPE